ncbi:MAG: hypothetical protein LBD08_06585 [Treponema sp.]|jgi:hypothetical protein|nr:hypothetical protein [Treponema sp.]
MHNEHTAAIPPAVITEITGLFQQILTKLEPYRTPLTAEERREMTIVGDKSLAFLEKGKEFIDLYPDLVPPWLNKAEFTADIDDVQNVLPIKNLAGQVQEAIYNISYLAGNEAYHWILDYYHSARQAASRDVPNAKIVADELGKRFKSRGRKSSKPAD